MTRSRRMTAAQRVHEACMKSLVRYKAHMSSLGTVVRELNPEPTDDDARACADHDAACERMLNEPTDDDARACR